MFGVLAPVLWVGTVPMISVMLVVFPGGVPAAGWWRRVFVAQMVALGILVPVLADQADGDQIMVLNVLGGLAGVALLVTGAARALWLVVLWWRADGERRRQLFSFVVVTAALAGFYGIGVASFLITGDTDFAGGQVQSVVFPFLVAGLPTAIGLSVLRHRLYGIESPSIASR